ncbi:MAG: DUF5348 domain-containing protein [Oscillospiraceae bacterium]|nr:DUF5348 domain-containing protein [Oscillospiraceae bacterium]
MLCGTIFYTSENNYVDIHMDNEQNFGELNQGMPLEIFLCGQWLSTRLEKTDNNWYLAGLNGLPLPGLRARIAQGYLGNPAILMLFEVKNGVLMRKIDKFKVAKSH